MRIAVNGELENIKNAMDQAVGLLNFGGRLVAISFHGLEDKTVKEKFKNWQKQNIGKMLTKKPIIPTEEEVGQNPRSRSAKMRVFENIEHES